MALGALKASRDTLSTLVVIRKGGANNGEDLRKAAMREPREETEFLAEAPYWLTYDFPIKVKNKLNRREVFTGNEEEINLLGDGSEKPEFKEWSWRLPEQVVELVHEQVLKVFSPYFSLDANEEHSTENEPNGREVHKQTTTIGSKFSY